MQILELPHFAKPLWKNYLQSFMSIKIPKENSDIISLIIVCFKILSKSF
jgi:hypothetical protein